MGIDILQSKMDSIEEQIEERRREFSNTYRSLNGLSIPEIMVLYYARSFRTDTESFQSFWGYKYGISDVRSVIEMLLKRGFISVGSVADGLNYYKVPELKDLLDKYGLKKTGKKDDLIMRIIDNIPESELAQLITSKPYELTELGIRELENNQYIPYFHNNQNSFTPQINVCWLNRELHNRPEFQSHWRDLIWGKLNEETLKATEEATKGDYYWYIQNRRTMALFLMEENRYLEALRLITEAAYYEVNKRSAQIFLNEYRIFVLERHEPEPDLINLTFLYTDVFSQIQKKLQLSNEDFACKIRELAAFPPLKEEFVPVNLLSAWVLAEIMQNENQLTFLRSQYRNKVLKSGNLQ